MQIAQRSSVAARAARPSRSAVVVRASAESSRRAVLGGFLAGVAALSGAKEALAVATPVDFSDDRKAKANGFDLIYEARDLDLPQAVRDGLTQARSSLDETKARVKASESRVDSLIEKSVTKNYWTEAREELRRQVGTLRFDLNTLASSKATKAEKKKAQELKNTFIAKVEALDLALRKKDEKSATAALDAVKSSLDAVLAFVL